MENRGLLVPVPFSRTDDNYCNSIYSCLTAVHCLADDYVGKHLWLGENVLLSSDKKDVQESMDWWTARHNVTEIMSKNGVKHHTVKSIMFCIHQPFLRMFLVLFCRFFYIQEMYYSNFANQKLCYMRIYKILEK